MGWGRLQKGGGESGEEGMTAWRTCRDCLYWNGSRCTYRRRLHLRWQFEPKHRGACEEAAFVYLGGSSSAAGEG